MSARDLLPVALVLLFGMPSPARARSPIRIGTLAYVVNECRVDREGKFTGRQRLLIRRGERPPVQVLEVASAAPVVEPIPLCLSYGLGREGTAAVLIGVFHRLALRPDGKAVVFELTAATSLIPVLSRATSIPEEGFYFVYADGTGLRRLGPASRIPDFLVYPTTGPDADGLVPLASEAFGDLYFSPDGGTVAYTDIGPAPDGAEAPQVMVLDVDSGRRTQVTSLPEPRGVPPRRIGTRAGAFLDRDTLAFSTYGDGTRESVFTVDVDGTGLRRLPDAVATPGSALVPSFQLTGRRARVLTLELPGERPDNATDASSRIREPFLFDGRHLLQLVRFHREDTDARAFVGARAFLTGSADPFGNNPEPSCQLFSIRRDGTGLRQLTAFRGNQGRCTYGTPECYIAPVIPDVARRTLVFLSSCPRYRPNAYAAQVYALDMDGGDPRALTDTAGLVIEGDGGYRVELPGPIAYASGR